MSIQEDVELFAVSARRFGAKVEINDSLPTVAVTLEGKEYFFQGEEAVMLLDDAAVLADVSREDFILWMARGW